jgi:hypothetical protein
MEQWLLADCLNIFSSPLITEIVITAGKITHILSKAGGGGGELIETGIGEINAKFWSENVHER